MRDDDHRWIDQDELAPDEPSEHDLAAEDDLTLEEWRDALAVLALLDMDEDEEDEEFAEAPAWIH
jgi:hypothetical protein